MNSIGEKVLPFSKVFDEKGVLWYKKDMAISIFDCIDKIMKNENSKQMSFNEIESLVDICDQPDKILESIFVNYPQYQYFDPDFSKT